MISRCCCFCCRHRRRRRRWHIHTQRCQRRRYRVVYSPHTIANVYSIIQYDSDTYLSSLTKRMRISVPLKRERLCMVWILLTHSLVRISCSHALTLSFSLSLDVCVCLCVCACARYIELNKLSVRGLFNATGSFVHSLAGLLILMDGIRSRHCTHNMLDDSHFSISILCVLTKCTLPYNTKSFAYRLTHSRYAVCMFCIFFF